MQYPTLEYLQRDLKIKYLQFSPAFGQRATSPVFSDMRYVSLKLKCNYFFSFSAAASVKPLNFRQSFLPLKQFLSSLITPLRTQTEVNSPTFLWNILQLSKTTKEPFLETLRHLFDPKQFLLSLFWTNFRSQLSFFIGKTVVLHLPKGPV